MVRRHTKQVLGIARVEGSNIWVKIKSNVWGSKQIKIGKRSKYHLLKMNPKSKQHQTVIKQTNKN